MPGEITQIDATQWSTIVPNADGSDIDTEPSRWTKGDNDRLYLNGPSKVEYVSLDSLFVKGTGSAVTGSAEVVGDELHVTAEISGDTVLDATFRVPADLAEDDEEEDDEGEEDEEGSDAGEADAEAQDIVTDGGETDAEDSHDTRDIVSDDDIQAAINQHDDPEHPDALSVVDVHDVLGQINAGFIDLWSAHEDSIDEGVLEVVTETRDVLVLADETGQFWNEEFRHLDVDDEFGILRRVVLGLHHTAARRRCDRSWSVADPVVISKPDAMRAGEEHVLREIARRTKEVGSVARAVDQLATEVHDWSKSRWADQTGRNRSTVTRMTQPKGE